MKASKQKIIYLITLTIFTRVLLFSQSVNKDVLIIGGGASGTAAAVKGAR